MTTSGSGTPQALTRVRAPLTPEFVQNAVLGLGPGATAAQSLVDAGLVPPDVLVGMTLFLLSGQPRREASEGPVPGGAAGKKRSAVGGGVWVREQTTIHRPVRVDEVVDVTGEVARRYTRNGRMFSVTTSETHRDEGELLVSGCTTGLVRYRRDPTLADAEAGRSEEELARPGATRGAARRNPALGRLRELRAGDELRGEEKVVSLDLMRARDGGQSRNPIHTDPAAARDAGLVAPIAGGSHVLAYALEVVMQAWGSEALLYGTQIDAAFRSQVRAGDAIEPRVTVRAVSDSLVDVELRVVCGGRDAVTGSLSIPVGG